MEKVVSIENYKCLWKEGRLRSKDGYNNFYLNFDEAQRYCALGRLYYEMQDSGLIIFTDEESCYRMHVLLRPDAPIVFYRQDKPLLFRNIYKENMKTDAQTALERILEKQGFALEDSSVQILARPLENQKEIREKYEKAAAFLNRMKIQITYAKEENLEEIEKIRDDEPALKPYHFLYRTKEETLQDIRNGYFRCAVDDKGRLCAVQQFSVVNRTVQGNWLAVKEAYKVKYGIGTAMAYHSFLYAIERGIANYYGWVVRANKKSLAYHQAIGYTLTDKIADEWILT